MFTSDDCVAQITRIQRTDDPNREALLSRWRNRLAHVLVGTLDRAAEAERTLSHGVQVGDIFSTTIRDAQIGTLPAFFEVVQLRGTKSGVLRQILARKTTESFVQGWAVPVSGAFCGDAFSVVFRGSADARLPGNEVRCNVKCEENGRRFRLSAARLTRSEPQVWASYVIYQ